MNNEIATLTPIPANTCTDTQSPLSRIEQDLWQHRTGEELVARERERKKLTPEQALLLSNDPRIWRPL